MTTGMNIAFETIDLGRRYRRHWALQHCSIRVPEGSVVGLVGQNGVGKTTLLHLAVGLLAPTTGTALVYGEPVRQDPAMLARVGFVAQEKPLYPSFTVAEMLRLGAAMNPRWDGQSSEERLRTLGIPLEQRTGKLSGGQQAQVALALAIGKQPDLLLLDEPIANLDPLARRMFLQVLMDEVARTGMTVVLSSHLVADLDQVCDRLILLSAGHVQLDASVEELLASHRLLIGPRDREDAALRNTVVVHRTHAGRQTTAVVCDAPALLDPDWQSRPVTLEELLLAYMQSDTNQAAAAGWPGLQDQVSA
jgi:ABC-2 type transport system ATP-binding protein